MVFGKRRIPKHLIINENQDNYHHYKSSMGYGWIIAAILLVLASIFISIKSHANQASHVDYSNEEYNNTTGQIFFINKNGTKTPGLHLKSDVSAEIHGMIAKVTYQQTFQNDTQVYQEGTYVFPLSETAAINGMSIKIGERLIVGNIKEREEAKKINNQAVTSGKKAALTEQQRANLFTQKVGNIAPGEKIIVTLTYIERIDFSHQEFSWRLPTTLTPRYIPSVSPKNKPNNSAIMLEPQKIIDEPTNENTNTAETETVQLNTEFGWALPNHHVPDAHLITPPLLVGTLDQSMNTIGLSIELNSGLSLAKIDSPYHDIQVKKSHKKHYITLANKREKMDRDFVLTWSATEESTPKIAAYSEKIDNKYYTMLMLVPPERTSNKQSNQKTLDSDRIFIIDTSGSMQGESMVQAKESLKIAIQALGHNIRFNIIEFNSNYSKLFHNLQTADNQSKIQALKWVDRLRANGGTEMYAALDASMIELNNGEERRLKQIVFITDGSVGNEHSLFEIIHKKLKSSRLFTVGIGSAPNSFFMRKSAQFGRGSFTHIGDTAEVSKKMLKVLKKIDSVATKNIQIDFSNGTAQDTIDTYPKKIGELYYGEPLLISSESDKAIESITISGQSAGESWSKSVVIPHTKEYKEPKGISTLWARSKIESLEDEKITRMRDLSDIKNDIIDVGITHKLVSKHTSFVAVEQEITRNPGEHLEKGAIPNLAPKGFKASDVNLNSLNINSITKQVAYPNTATTAEITWWLGLFSAMILIVFRRMSDDDS